MSTIPRLHVRINGSNLTLLREILPDGPELILADWDAPLEDQARVLHRARSVLAFPSRFPVELAHACPHLEHVQVLGSGTDTLDKRGLANLGIAVSNNHGSNAPAVAEHTIVLMFVLLRKLAQQFEAVHRGLWLRELMRDWLFELEEFTDKTVGIVGLGKIGQAVATRLSTWGCRVLYHDIVEIDSQEEAELGVERRALVDLLEASDIVTLHVPLSSSTLSLMNKKEFETMRPNAILINTSRGEVVDEQALLTALRTKRIRGAALDVLANEPPDLKSELLSMPNVVVTPHLAGGTIQSFRRSVEFAAQNVLRVGRGEPPLSVVEQD